MQCRQPSTTAVLTASKQMLQVSSLQLLLQQLLAATIERAAGCAAALPQMLLLLQGQSAAPQLLSRLICEADLPRLPMQQVLLAATASALPLPLSAAASAALLQQALASKLVSHPAASP
jgi:hypothetical protein